eukprot:14671716-Alexandrium_andersonii.AAC.1
MSASLVGSEMCIRDRDSTDNTHALWGSGRRPHWGPMALAESILGSARTVSYTHLTLPTICSV